MMMCFSSIYSSKEVLYQNSHCTQEVVDPAWLKCTFCCAARILDVETECFHRKHLN